MDRSPRLAKLREPVWDMWLRRPRVTGQQAIALACGIDPGALDREMERLSNGHTRSVLDQSPVFEWLSQYQNALDSFDPAFGDGLTAPRKMSHLVPLDAFARWAVDTADAISGWTVPDRLRSFASDVGRAPISAGAAKWPWGDYETKYLAHLKAAVVEFWAKWDGQAASAPKNEVVIAWLKSRDISDRIAAAMATILRSDRVPDGPRPRSSPKRRQKG
jgi:hypothetical protein